MQTDFLDVLGISIEHGVTFIVENEINILIKTCRLRDDII